MADNPYGGVGWVWVSPDQVNYNSLKNHLSNRAVLTAQPYEEVTCTNPGMNRPYPAPFKIFYMSNAGQRCSDFPYARTYRERSGFSRSRASASSSCFQTCKD